MYINPCNLNIDLITGLNSDVTGPGICLVYLLVPKSTDGLLINV